MFQGFMDKLSRNEGLHDKGNNDDGLDDNLEDNKHHK